MEVDGITWLHCPILLDSWNSSKLLLGHGEFHTDRLAAAKAFAAYGDFMYLPSQDMAASENKDTPRWMVSDALPSYSLVLVDTMVIGDGLFSLFFWNQTLIISLRFLQICDLFSCPSTRCGSGRGTACNTQVARPQVTVAAIQKKRRVGKCLETSII